MCNYIIYSVYMHVYAYVYLHVHAHVRILNYTTILHVCMCTI
jgi:hypothetical protein